MEYKKPTVIVLGLAIRAIQGCGSKSNQQQDCETNQKSPGGAYEADE